MSLKKVFGIDYCGSNWIIGNWLLSLDYIIRIVFWNNVAKLTMVEILIISLKSGKAPTLYNFGPSLSPNQFITRRVKWEIKQLYEN